MRVVGFTGMPGSGKSEAMEVAKTRGHPVVRMGDLIWEEVDRQGLPRDARHVGQVANGMRESHGKDVWAKRTAERVRAMAAGHGLVLIDGIRSQEEVRRCAARSARTLPSSRFIPTPTTASSA